jgi:hypothetical protein
MVPGTRYPVPDTRYQVPVPAYLVPGTTYHGKDLRLKEAKKIQALGANRPDQGALQKMSKNPSRLDLI